MAGLYIHIPFCRSKCAYCDFASYAGRERDLARYVCALTREMEMAARKWGRVRVDSVFLGGGTPTLLSGGQIGAILRAARERFDVSERAEISMEGNPGTLDARALAACRAEGVNRLSLGVQAVQPELLRALGRIHTRGEAERGVAMARDAGFANINLDLMAGLPGQTREHMRETVDWALSMSPEHVSCYALTLEPGTPLALRVDARECALPEEDETADMLADAARALARGGLAQYEVSNFARAGYRCAHNLCYWRYEDWLGLGCAAHGKMAGVRTENARALSEYIERCERGEPPGTDFTIAPGDARFEMLMMGLRLTEGVSFAAFEARMGADARALWAEPIDKNVKLGLMELGGDSMRLTPRGYDLMNRVLIDFLDG